MELLKNAILSHLNNNITDELTVSGFSVDATMFSRLDLADGSAESGSIELNNGATLNTLEAIVGLAGLQPTIDIIKVSKTVAMANKETIICGWGILSKLIKKYKTKMLPVDSEHFSIMELTKGVSDKEIEEIISIIPVDTALGIRDHAIVEILYSCGLRVTELCEIEVIQPYIDPTIDDQEEITYHNENGTIVKIKTGEAKELSKKKILLYFKHFIIIYLKNIFKLRGIIILKSNTI